MAWRPFRPAAIKESLIPETTGDVALGSNAKKWLAAFIVTLTIATFTLTGRMTTGGFVNMTGVLFVDNATSKVGIGTATPAETLAVTGNLSTTLGANFATSSGNVGIGTTGPVSNLEVQEGASPEIRINSSDANSFPALILNNEVQGWAIQVRGDQPQSMSDNALAINDVSAGTFPLVMDTSGNVGIGTTTPTHKLEVAGSMNVSGNLNVSGFMTLGETGYNWALLGNPSGTFVWSDITSDASRLTINASGHVTIGINMSIAGLNGVGNGFACINSIGDIYRSASACA